MIEGWKKWHEKESSGWDYEMGEGNGVGNVG